MNEQQQVRPSLPRFPMQLEATIRFVVNLIALWAMCAFGIYLMGPGESEQLTPSAVAQMRISSDYSTGKE